MQSYLLLFFFLSFLSCQLKYINPIMASTDTNIETTIAPITFYPHYENIIPQ